MKGYYRFIAGSLCLLCVTLFACRPTNQENLDAAKVLEIDAGKETIDSFADAVESVRVLRLSRPGDSFIGEVNKVTVSESYIYILDSRKAKALFVYDTGGQFVYAINQIGRGPGEFMMPNYFDVDNKNKEVLVLDSGTRKLIMYDMSGRFIKELKLPFFVNSFIVYDDNHILVDCGNNTFGDNGNYRLSLLDRTTGAIVEQLIEIPEELSNVNHSPISPLFKLDNSILYQPPASNLLYEVRADAVEGRYVFDFGRAWPSLSYFDSVKDSTHPLEVINNMNERGFVLFANIMENEAFVLLYYTLKNTNYIAIYDKKTSGLTQFRRPANFDNPVGVSGDEFIFAKISDDGDMVMQFVQFKKIMKDK